MKHMRFRILRLVIPLCLMTLVAVQALAQTDPNAIFATVNGEEIKSSEFWHRLAWYRVDPSSPLAQLPAGFLTVNQLITEHLVYEMARDKGCSPTDLEVQAEMKRRETADPNLLSDLKSEGRPENDLYQEVKYDLAQYKLRTFGITITDQEVEQHYRSYPEEFTNPKQYSLKVIVVNSDDASSVVDQELSSGKSFSEVASAHSEDYSKYKGGDFGTIAVSQLAPPAASALSAIKIGQTTDWVTSKEGQIKVKYLLVNIIPSALRPLDDELRYEIRRKLSLDKGEIKNKVIDDLHKAMVGAKVAINQQGFQKIFDQLVASYTKTHAVGE